MRENTLWPAAARKATFSARATVPPRVAMSVWTQSITFADLSDALTIETLEERCETGLPWGDGSVWPLPEEQIRLLSFELLLLSRPSPPESTKAPGPSEAAYKHEPSSPARLLQSMPKARRQQLAAVLSTRLVEGLVVLDDEHEEAVLPALLQPPPRDAKSGATLPAPSAGASAKVHAAESSKLGAEELLEARLASGMDRASKCLEERRIDWLDGAVRLVHETAHGLGLWTDSPLPRGRGTAQRAAPVPRAKLDDLMLEEVRLQLGIRRDMAVRLARLLILPPPPIDPATGALLTSTPLPTLAERAIYADVQPYVFYRMMLLQHLRPVHFGRHAEYAAFAERQLAAFTCGLLSALHSAPQGHRWEVTSAMHTVMRASTRMPRCVPRLLPNSRPRLPGAVCRPRAGGRRQHHSNSRGRAACCEFVVCCEDDRRRRGRGSTAATRAHTASPPPRGSRVRIRRGSGRAGASPTGHP